jgi:hypothetical protein
MHRFLIGYSLPFAACLGLAGWTHARFGVAYPADWVALGLTLLAAPILASLAAVSLVHIRRPRRWLMRGTPGRIRAGVFGLLAGTAAIPLIGIALYFANRPMPGTPDFEWSPGQDMRRVHDAVIVAPLCFATAWIGASLMPRRRAGSCAACGYDVRYSLDSGRCPECGRAI